MRNVEHCPACKSSSIRPRFKHRTADGQVWQVCRCAGCELGFLSPCPSWEELSPYYAADYHAYASDGGDASTDEQVIVTAEQTGELIHVPVVPGARLLDVGCSSGRFLRLANRLGMIAEGVEPSELASSKARAAGCKVFTGTIDQYVAAKPEGMFDLIVANHVLEHVPDPVATLRHMKQLLTSEGMICIAVPNADCWAARSLKGRWHSSDLPRHLMHFTPRSLEVCAQRVQLRTVRLITYSLPRATASSLRMWLRARLFVPWRVSKRLGVIDSFWAEWLGRRIDKRCAGEAIVARFSRDMENG